MSIWSYNLVGHNENVMSVLGVDCNISHRLGERVFNNI